MSSTNGDRPVRAPLGQRLKALREERGLSQDKLCRALDSQYGIHATSGGISYLEIGKHHPRPALLNALCEYFGADIREFPEWWRAKAHLALGDGENKLVRYDKDLQVDALEDLVRARRLEEAGGPAAAADVIRRTVPAPRPKRRAASQPKTG